ncbi:MAG: S41 family peptidase, partial [Chloroflexi bacterium]|nr:S41 family peptidase [Chloroflexota bacterium]
AIILVAGAFSAGILLGWAIPHQTASAMPLLNTPVPTLDNVDPSTVPDGQPTATATDTNTLFAPFWEAWQIVHDQYVDQPVDDVTLMQGAIRGMLDSLGDQHTSYMDPLQYSQSTAPLQGEYDGIGAWVDSTGEILQIISPMPDSPAEAAGLLPGDYVIAVDGQDMVGVDGSIVLRHILGPAGTQVTLTIQRNVEGESEPEVFDVDIERAKISMPSVESHMIEGENIAYLYLTTFGEDTATVMRQSLQELLANNPDGLILDLRNNGGGYLQTAVDVVSEYLDPNQVILIEEFGDGTTRNYTSNRGGLATQIPLVVLVNEGTASASEITAGAIQDYGRGTLVGATTYGKGSVQQWVPLLDDQGAVRVTIARWLTPNGRQINEVGLKPDIEVEYTQEDFAAGRDPQLDRAIEFLKTGK